MYISKKKILCILLAVMVFLSLFSSCVPAEDHKEPDNIVTEEPSDIPEKDEELPLPPVDEEPEEEPVVPEIPQTPVIGEQDPEEPPAPEDEEIPESPSEEPLEGDLPTEDVPEDVKELPRDKFGLPMPLTALSEESLRLCLAKTETVGYDYFDTAVFLGDSVTLGLKNYTTKKRKKIEGFLSNASFIAVGSYGVYEALKTPSDTTIHALYGGVQTQPQDILSSLGAETVFICLGLNDVGLFSKQDHLMHYATLILRIQTTCPGIKIVILSTTPLTLEGERKHLYNRKIDEYNAAVIELAKQYNCYFADVASVLKDEEGYLTYELSSDNYCHLEDEAYDMIIEYLMTHATPDAVSSESEIRDTVIEQPADVEGYEGEMGEW